MANQPRTIDQLGIDVSSRYARDQALLDPELIKESRFIGQKAEVSAIKPYLPTEFEHYLMPTRLSAWAAFPLPPESVLQGKPLFTHQMIPSLGSMEKQEADMERLQALKESLKNKEKSKEEKIVEQEAVVVLKLLETIHSFDRVLSSVNARRNQYQRG